MFSSITVAETKVSSVYNFAASLNLNKISLEKSTATVVFEILVYAVMLLPCYCFEKSYETGEKVLEST